MFNRVAPDSCKQMSCNICSVDTAMYYNEIWHSRLPKTNKGNLLRNKHCAFFAAVYDLNIFAIAIWTTPVAANRMSNGYETLELRRLAISSDAPKYTATWMLSKMIKYIKSNIPQIVKLVSYQDIDVHSGTIYKAANWKLEATTKYTDWNTSTRIRKSIVQSRSDKNRWVYILDK
jgi:hypothetical protein